MKRYLVLVLILVLATAAGYFYFYGEQSIFSKDSTVYRAIPTSAPFFFELNSAKSVSVNNPVINELKEAGIGKPWFDFLLKADSLVDHTENLTKSLLNTPFLITWGITGRNEMVPLIISKAESETRRKSLKAFINALYPPANFTFREREYGKHKITEIDGGDSETPLCYSFVNNLLLVSTKPILVEQVILQMTTPGIMKSPYFREVYKTTGSKGAAFFINHSRFDGFLGNILNRKIFEKTDEFGTSVRFQPLAQASKFKDYASWSELDISFENDRVLLNGISAADDSLNHFLSVFKDQEPVHFHAEEVLPVNTSFFNSYSFSEKNKFFKRLEEYYAHSSKYYHREERMKRFDKGFRTNIRKVFVELVKDEVVVAATAIPVNPANKTVYFILHTHGKTAAEEQIKKLICDFAIREKKDPGEFSSEFSVDNEVKFPIYHFPYPSFPGIWLGSPFTMAEANYVTFYDNFMVFSNNLNGLHEYLRNMVLGTNLSNNLNYQKFSKNNSSKANMNVFIDVNKIFSYRNELFSENFLKPLDEREESVRKFGMINWQVQYEKSVFINSVAISFQPVAGVEAKTTWQSVVGNNLLIKPQIMVNHTNASSCDILLQDDQNNLLQVTGSGRVRWNIPISQPILSEIHQVDVYKNGKLQYLFNTKEKLYLIDRNGNNVKNFPVTLLSPATNGVNVFDYDNNRDYRIFLAGENREIYAFNKEGKILSGWTFNKTEQEVNTPVQHFRVEGKDYIVFKDKSGIYIQDRQGEKRVPVSARFENSKNPLVLNLNGKPKIVATDKNGKVFYIYFDGKVEEKKTARFSENHFFTVDDLDGDNLPEFVFADGNEITVLNQNGKKIFNRKFNNPLIHKPGIYSFSARQKKIGITDAATNRIYLINPDGKLHEGFPLQGNSEFSIGRIDKNAEELNLIVGSEGGLLFNYTLNP